MSNIVKFPHGKESTPEPYEAKPRHVPELQTHNDQPSAVWTKLWMIVRVPLFLVLYWLRAPVMLVCNLISFPLLLMWLFAWIAWPERTVLVWGFATISFGAFVVLWLYDTLLMALSPQDIVRTL